MAVTSLGRLEPVELREAWESEAGHFTPWLARQENLALLGETIGVDLVLEAQEKDVGPFRADILCKDTITQSWVLIENQLERTDHTHLGQLLAYAAGLQAVTIVWIARQFTEEHRATLDWLNEITDERFNFFGLEVELWRIGNSAVAPKFNMVCKPNDWSKTITNAARSMDGGASSEFVQIKIEFWNGLKEYLRKKNQHVSTSKIYGGGFSLGIGRKGFFLRVSTSGRDDNGLEAKLIMDGPNAGAHYGLLLREKAQIEQDYGQPLVWREVPGQITRVIATVKADFRFDNRSCWPEAFEWLRCNLDHFQRVFARRIAGLNADNYEPEGDGKA